jgi:hypothetical protein
MIAALAPFLPFCARHLDRRPSRRKITRGHLNEGFSHQSDLSPCEPESVHAERMSQNRATLTILALDDDEAALKTRQDTRRSRLCSSSDKLAPSQPLTNPRTNRQCRTTARRGYKLQARSIEVQAAVRPSRARQSSCRQYGPWQPDDHWAPHCQCDVSSLEQGPSAQCSARAFLAISGRASHVV